jgi:hypothetical protein
MDVMTNEPTTDAVKDDSQTSPMARRALFGLGLGALASLLLPAETADAAVVIVRRRRSVVVVARPRWRRKVIIVR